MKITEIRICIICGREYKIKNAKNRKTCGGQCSVKNVDQCRVEYRNSSKIKARNIKCQKERYLKKKEKEVCMP